MLPVAICITPAGRVHTNSRLRHARIPRKPLRVSVGVADFGSKCRSLKVFDKTALAQSRVVLTQSPYVLHISCTTWINCFNPAHLTGWNSRRAVSLCVNCGVEIRFKFAEYVIIEPTVLDLAKLMLFRKLFLELDGKVTPVLMDILSEDWGRCADIPGLESVICALLKNPRRGLSLEQLIAAHVIHD
jgi:hypothetical protein